MQGSNKTSFDDNWHDLWVKQASSFYETAERYLGDIFKQGKYNNPNEFQDQIKEWMDVLQSQWQIQPDKIKANEQEAYWQHMFELYHRAGDLMLAEWIKRADSDNPVKNIQQLYELWFDSCQEIYQQMIRSSAYQKAYAEFMRATLKFW